MIVYCTPAFISQANKLSKNSSYSSVFSDVSDFLKDKTIGELHKIKDIICQHPGIYSINKYRICNSIMNKGKSGSYRCISACHPAKKFIVLGFIYPKTGSERAINLSKKEYKDIAAEIKNAIASKNLSILNLDSNLLTKYD